MTSLNTKQKKFIVLTSTIIILFCIFAVLSFSYVNKHEKGDSSNTATSTNSNEESLTDSAASITPDETEEETKNETSDNIAKDEADKTLENAVSNTENNSVNTQNNGNNNNTESTSRSDTQNNSKDNTNYGGSTNNSNSGNNSEADVPSKPDHKAYTINIRIANVDTVFYSGTVESDTALTALDALMMYTDKMNISVKKQGSGSIAYVTSIDNIKEKDYGPSSGWMYKVNNSFASIACGKYSLNSGDTLEWVYTKDGGKDVGSR